MDPLTPALSRRERGKSLLRSSFHPLPRRGRGEGEGGGAIPGVVFLLVVLFLGCARFVKEYPPALKGQVVEGRFQEIPYHLLTFPSARGGEGFPLVLSFHGRGDSPAESMAVWKDAAEERGVMVLAPAYEGVQGLEPFYELVNFIAEKYPVDSQKRFLAGISAGALYARWTLFVKPSFWRGVIFIAGPSAENWPETADLKGVPPILFVHGEKDLQGKVEGIVRHVETLKRRGVKVRLLKDPAAGHEHRPEWNPKIFDWMENA